MKLFRALYVHWPVLLFVSTALTAWLYDPALIEADFPFSWNIARVVASLSSMVFWIFTSLSVVGIVLVHRVWRRDPGFSDTDKMATLWFLLNATWFHTGCDLMSGLFQVMPNLTESYIAINEAHALPMHDPGRIQLDVVYWLELFPQLPLALTVAVLYLRRSPVRPIVETFLNGIYVAGTSFYYLPNLILGHSSHGIMSNLDRSIGSIWIITSVALTIRAVRQVRSEGAPSDGAI
jgi:hypothetical protein